MKINILGPVEVWVNGDQVRLARRQQRLIVGMLALQSNRWVPADMLIEALWGQRAPAAARSILRTRVSEVRSALGPASGPLAITTSSGAYRLQAGPDCLDVQQFTQLLEQAKGAAPPARRTMLTDALALWRGPVLGGNGVEQVWVPLVGALESDRLTAVEDLLEAELELHNHRQVADSALRYALANPSRERITVQAMRALAAADRDADALRLYEQSRRWLRDELGLDPTSAMQQLYLDILHRADPATPPVTIVPTGAAGPAAAPAPASDETAAVRPVVAGADASQFLPASPNLLPPDLPDFTGRATEQARLHELLTEEGTTSRVVAIIGPGGVGKTTLAIRAARALLSCYPDGQLYADLNGLTQDAAAQPADVLARFLRALGVEGTGLPENLDELADLYRNLLSHRRVLILLDNASSDGQVAPLIPGNPGCAVIATSRSRIGGTIAATPIELDVFNSAEARTLLTRVIGDHRVSAEESAVAELSQQCGFLPLAIRIAAAKLATKDHWSVAKLVDMLSDENHRLGHFTHGRLGVPAALSLSYQGLPADARKLLGRIGWLGLPEIPVWLAAALLDSPLEAAEELLELLFDVYLVGVAGHEPDGSPRYGCHDLVRLFARQQAACEESVDGLREAHTRALGAFLHITDHAHEWIFGGCFQTFAGSFPRWPIESDTTSRLLTDPLRWFDINWRGIVDMATHRDHHAGSWELACAASPMFQMRRMFDSWRSMLEQVLPRMRAAGDRRGEAAVRHQLGSVSLDLLNTAEAQRQFQRSAELVAALHDRHAQAVITTHMGILHRFTGDDARALEHFRAAERQFRSAAHRGGEALTVRAQAQVAVRMGELAEAEQLFERALALYKDCGGRQGVAQVLFFRSLLLIEQGCFDQALTGLRQALDICRLIGDRVGEAQCIRGIGTCYLHQGDHMRARATLLTALQLVKQPRPTLVESYIRATLDAVPDHADVGVVEPHERRQLTIREPQNHRRRFWA